MPYFSVLQCLKKPKFDDAASFIWPADYGKKKIIHFLDRLKSMAIPGLLQRTLCAVKSDDVVKRDVPQSFLHSFSPLENSPHFKKQFISQDL